MNGAAQCHLLPQWGAAVLGKMKRMRVFFRRPLAGGCQTFIFSLKCNVGYFFLGKISDWLLKKKKKINDPFMMLMLFA